MHTSTRRSTWAGRAVATCWATYPPYDAPTSMNEVRPSSSTSAKRPPRRCTRRPAPAPLSRNHAGRSGPPGGRRRPGRRSAVPHPQVRNAGVQKDDRRTLALDEVVDCSSEDSGTETASRHPIRRAAGRVSRTTPFATATVRAGDPRDVGVRASRVTSWGLPRTPSRSTSLSSAPGRPARRRPRRRRTSASASRSSNVRESVGGVAVTHLGMVPSKTLREASLYLSGFRKRRSTASRSSWSESALYRQLQSRTDEVSRHLEPGRAREPGAAPRRARRRRRQPPARSAGGRASDAGERMLRRRRSWSPPARVPTPARHPLRRSRRLDTETDPRARLRSRERRRRRRGRDRLRARLDLHGARRPGHPGRRQRTHPGLPRRRDPRRCARILEARDRGPARRGIHRRTPGGRRHARSPSTTATRSQAREGSSSRPGAAETPRAWGSTRWASRSTTRGHVVVDDRYRTRPRHLRRR